MTTTTKVSKKKKPNTTSTAPAMDEFGHLQPQAIDLEKAVLGAVMIEQDAYSLISETLSPESFYDHRHELIFNAVRQLNIEQKPVDELTVIEQLQRTGELEDAGGIVYVDELCAMVQSSAHIEYHAGIIADKSRARQLITYSSNLQTKAFDATQDIDELMQEAEGKLFQLTQQNVKKDYVQIDEVLRQAYDKIIKAAQNTGGLSGVPSGYTDLDKITSGWQEATLVILAARPAMGKSAFALSMAKNMAVDSHIPTAFFSLEMSNVEVVNRLISNACEITGEKIKNGQLAPFEWQQLDAKIQGLFNAPLYVDDTPNLSVFELRTKARRLVREHNVEIIMIDYLQLMNAAGMNFHSRQEEVAIISRSLKGLAKELNIPILALSQLNRGVESRVNSENTANNRPQLSDLRESGSIEQDADMVLFIHRPEYYKQYQDQNGRDLRGKAEIIIAKHRSGAVGDVLLTFKGQFVRFQNLDEEISAPLLGEEGEELGRRMHIQSEMPPVDIDNLNGAFSTIPPLPNGNEPLPF